MQIARALSVRESSGSNDERALEAYIIDVAKSSSEGKSMKRSLGWRSHGARCSHLIDIIIERLLIDTLVNFEEIGLTRLEGKESLMQEEGIANGRFSL